MRQRARETVEEPVGARHGLQLSRDESDHGGVGHEVALVDERLGLLAQRGAVLDVSAE